MKQEGFVSFLRIPYYLNQVSIDSMDIVNLELTTEAFWFVK